MRINGTQQAFKALLDQRGVFNALGVQRSTVSTWKKAIREEKRYPSEKTMMKFLKKAGAKVIKYDIIWEVREAV